MFPIVAVPHDAADLIEQLGAKRKFWFTAPPGVLKMFKEGRPNTGENWAEKVSCEIAKRLALPCADYELATWRGLNGVVTPTIVPSSGRLVLGNEILASGVKDYEATGFRAKEHRLNLVLGLMARPQVGLPFGYIPPPGITLAAHVFTGYLLLDDVLRVGFSFEIWIWCGRGHARLRAADKGTQLMHYGQEIRAPDVKALRSLGLLVRDRTNSVIHQYVQSEFFCSGSDDQWDNHCHLQEPP